MAANVWSTNNGIYCGAKVPDPEKLPGEESTLDLPWTVSRDLYQYKGEGHIITFGPPGTGKTRRLLQPNLLRLNDWSILVVDPKGTLAVQTGRYRKEVAKNNVITLDPFAVIPAQHPGLVDRQPYLKSAGLNPMAALDPEGDDFPDDAKTMAEALIKVEGQEPHFSKSAQALVAGLIMALRVEKGTAANLADLRLHLGLDAKSLGHAIKKKSPDADPGFVDLYGKKYPAIAAKLSRFSNISPENRELTGILSTAQTQTEWLDSGPVQRDLSQGVHNFGEMKKTPTTIYLILPPRYLESHSTWLRMMITAILMPLIRTIGGKVPVLFMLDEFAQLGRMEVIERNMALTREYGVKLWPILQDLSQLKQLYSERWESFISTAGIRLAFAPQDVTSLEYFSKLSGQRDYWYKTSGQNRTYSTGPQSSSSSGMNESWAKTQGPEYWEKGLARMDKGQAVIFSEGFNYRAFLPDPDDMPDIREKLERVSRASSPPPPPDFKNASKW